LFLADIGNRFAHLYYNGTVYDLTIDDLVEKFSDKKLYYINVNPKNIDRLIQIANWIDLSDYVHLNGAYNGMGIDRQMLLLSSGDGIYIDAGSAITIDLKVDNIFMGGTILPGIWRVKKAYSEISEYLKIDNIQRIDLNSLPSSSTKESVSYGIIAPIIALINSINRDDLPIYCCGGDGELVASYIDRAIYKKDLVFDGMKKVIKESRC